ncbi:AI-2E family transporter [Aeromicrobium sp.]|uniref:AI-2E family transporter n=1 Tax=Aeromicrobium sp. TaxID=1871063 RepID=UPI003D6A2236
MSRRPDRAGTGRDRAAVIDEAFDGIQRWGLRIIVLAAAVYVLGWIVGELWMIIFPVAMALIVSTVLVPAVSWLGNHKVPWGVASGVVVFGFLAAVVGIIAALTPQVAGQAPEIANSAARGLQQIRDWLTAGPLGLSEGQITRAIEAVQDRLRNSAEAISSGVFSTIGAATSAVVNLVLILMLTFFFLKDGHKFLPWMKTLGGRRAGEHSGEVMERAWDTLGGFIRTQSLVAFIDAIIIGTGLAILGVPLAVPLAVVTFFGGYIPIIGAFISGALAVLVTLVTNSPRDALIVLIIVIGVQQLEGNVLSPYLQGKNLNLHAGVVLLAVTAGGTLFGITGAFLAVPVAATTAEILRYVNERIDTAVDEDDAPPEDSRSADELERRADD